MVKERGKRQSVQPSSPEVHKVPALSRILEHDAPSSDADKLNQLRELSMIQVIKAETTCANGVRGLLSLCLIFAKL